MDFTRRQVILAGVVAGPALGLLAPSPAAAAPLVSSGATALREARFFSADYTRAYRLAFPGAVDLKAGASRPRALTVGAEGDSRVVAPGESVGVATLDATVAGVEIGGNQDDSRVASQFRAALTALGPWDHLSVSLPFVVLPRYPNDGVDLVSDVGFDVNATQQGGFSSEWAPEVIGDGGLAWGASVTARWAATASESDPYPFPTGLTVHSVGPGPIPAGSTVTVTVDRNAVGEVAVDRTGLPPSETFDQLYDSSYSDNGEALTVVLVVRDAIPAGGLVGFTLRVIPSTAPTKSTRAATIRFAPPAPDAIWQRQTRAELISYPHAVPPELDRAARGNK